MAANLTALIPIDLKRRSRDIINKAIFIAFNAEKSNVKVIFGHNNRNARQDKIFIKKTKKYSNVITSSIKSKSEVINVSQLRNLAFEQVDTDMIVLLDVDIFPDFSLFTSCATEIINKSTPFHILPCLYLTKYGTDYLRKKTSIEAIKEKYFSFSRKEFLHLACPSSIVVMKSEDYREITGFNPAFNGHGYEDFDFLLRLAERYNMINKSADFLLETSHRSPLLSTGFRKELGMQCINALIEKKMAFHLYHAKDNEENYYQRRKINYQLFSKLHQHNVSVDEHYSSSLLEEFIRICKDKKVNYQTYSIYFDNKPGHLDRTDTLKRRIKLIFNF
ncbi:galactosyltransferase-related protein [Enterobacter ludwigii]